jgi:hypothetical protein
LYLTVCPLLRSKQKVRPHFITDLLCHGSLSDDKNTQLSHVRQHIKHERYEESKREFDEIYILTRSRLGPKISFLVG